MIAKAPSSWRRGNSNESKKELNRNPSLSRYQVDNPHQKRVVSQDKARSTSINRVVYPEWWGESEPDDTENDKRFKKLPKRLKSADVHKAKINKNIARHCEDDLDKRLREV